jgi:hypothetical protein
VSEHTYKTELVFSLSDSVDADEHHIPLELRYTVYPGCEPPLEQPGEGPSTSIQRATIGGRFHPLGAHDAPSWLWSYLEGDEALLAEMLAHAAAANEYARDQAADARREERRLEER